VKLDAMDAAERPLAGKRIVMTRASEQAPTFFRALSEAGASVILLPCIDFATPEDWGPLDSALARLNEFDWIAFTSQNVVRFFRQRQREVDTSQSIPTSRLLKIAALGSATAEVATRAGLLPDFVASSARSGPEFVAAFAPLARGKQVLLPQSDQAGDRIAAALRDLGVVVTSVVAYRICVPESLDTDALARIRREGADMIFFGSPSAFRNFLQIIGKDAMKRFAKDSVFGAIGPTTAGAIRDAGLVVQFESPHPGTSEIVEAMKKYFAEKDRAKAHP
jgi:uroporphyrinogen III methyltransferase / synthase